MSYQMKVLVACEFSGIVRDAFIAKGHDAISVDLLPTDSPGPHLQGDVSHMLYFRWDMIIAHPPCTYLCNSGVRWLYNPDGSKNQERWLKMQQAAVFFHRLLYANASVIAVENPIMHKHAVHAIGRNYDFSVQPWQFGHGETKRTCFWTKGLSPLKPTNVVSGREARIHKMPPSKDRGKLRSITYKGIAKAMADQWG